MTKEKMRELFPRGTRIYTILRHVSRSGMQREIGVLAFRDGEVWHLNGEVRDLCGIRTNRDRDGVIVRGVGSDMGWYVVSSLAHAVHGDGDAFKQAWL